MNNENEMNNVENKTNQGEFNYNTSDNSYVKTQNEQVNYNYQSDYNSINYSTDDNLNVTTPNETNTDYQNSEWREYGSFRGCSCPVRADC